MSATVGRDRCWVVYTPDGSEWGDEYARHYDTEADARSSIDDARKDATRDDGTVNPDDMAALDKLTVTQMEAPCVTLQCDGCGYVDDEDEDGTVHFASLKAVDDVLGDLRWTWTAEGGYRCMGGDCKPETPPVVHCPGQLDLITGREVTTP